jgi:hypothetical protein
VGLGAGRAGTGAALKKLVLAVPVSLTLVVALLFALLATGLVGNQLPSDEAQQDIPAAYLALYQAAADTCPGLSWTVLAAIGKVETNHGRSTAPGVTSGANVAGAAGPMQFGIGGKAGNTWAAYGIDGDRPPDGRADVYDPEDAIFTAARYLCANGAQRDLEQAIFAYNRAGWYVQRVLAQAQRYSLAPALVASSTDVQALLANPGLTLTENARYDLEQGLVDARVVALLHLLLQSYTVHVSVFKTGHATYVRGTDKVSNHIGGRAVDIFQLNGEPVSASSGAARAVTAWLATGSGPLRPDEIGSPFAEFAGLPGAFTDGDHQDHLHIGWNG